MRIFLLNEIIEGFTDLVWIPAAFDHGNRDKGGGFNGRNLAVSKR